MGAANETVEEVVSPAGGGPPEDSSVDDNNCALFQLVLYSGVLGVMCLIGFAGNVASICVLQQDRTSSATATFLLRALAVADTAFLGLWMLHYSVRHVVNHLGLGDRNVWLYVRVACFPALYVAQTLTIWLMVVVACNRLIVICMPCRAHRLCCLRNFQLTVGLVVFGAFVSNAPRFFEIQLVRNETLGVVTWRRTSLADSAAYRIVYTDVVYYLLTFVLPLGLIVFANIRVVNAYRAARRLQQQNQPQQQQQVVPHHQMNENAITLVMIVIVGIFIVCQAPSRLVQIVWGYRFSRCRDDPRFYLIHLSNALEVFNSSVNFFVYVAFYKRFRLLLRRSLCRHCAGPLAERIRGGRDATATTEGLCLEENEWDPTDQPPPTTTAAADTGTGPAADGHQRLLVDVRRGELPQQEEEEKNEENALEASSNDGERMRLNADFKTPTKAIVLWE